MAEQKRKLLPPPVRKKKELLEPDKAHLFNLRYLNKNQIKGWATSIC